MRNLLLCSVLLSVGVFATGCAPDPPGGVVILSVDATPFGGLESVSLVVERVEIIHRTDQDDPTTEERMLLNDEEQLFSWSLSLDGPQVVGGDTYTLPEGFLAQMRFVVRDVEAIFVNGTVEEVTVKVPSGEQSGLKVIPADGVAFPLVEDEVTVINIQFDPETQMVFNPDKTLMKPTVPADLIGLEELRVNRVDEHRAVVLFENSATEADIQDALSEVGATEISRSPVLVRRLLVENRSLTAAELVLALKEQSSVRFAAREFVARLELTPDDPKFEDQKHLPQIKAPGAWDVTTGSRGVVVAVLDGAIETRNPELLKNIWLNLGELPTIRGRVSPRVPGFLTIGDMNEGLNRQFCDPTTDGDPTVCECTDMINQYLDGVNNDPPVDPNDPTADLCDANVPRPSGIIRGNCLVDDICGWNFIDDKPRHDVFERAPHGTHVAGLLGARGNNATEVAGVMWDVAIIPIQIFNSGGNTVNGSSRKGIELAAAYNADIINASWGATIFEDEGCHPIEDPGCVVDVQAVLDDWATFLDLVHDQVGLGDSLFVNSAGNEGLDLNDSTQSHVPSSAPAENVTIVRVGSVDFDDIKTGFTNFGNNNVDLVAPGRRILSLAVGEGTIRANGASQAAPQVAGVAGLMLAVDPTLDPSELKQILTSTTDRLPKFRNRFANGRLNAESAVRAAQ